MMNHLTETSINTAKNTEAVLMQHSNAKEKTLSRVMETLRARGRKNADTLILLQFDWPDTEHVLGRVVDSVADFSCNGSDPVIYSILDQALERYSKAVHFRVGCSYLDASKKDPMRLAIFIEALITETMMVVKAGRQNGCKGEWPLDQGVSLSEWLCEQGGLSEAEQKLKPCMSNETLRSTLYELFTSERVRSILRRVGYEEAVVGGCPHSSC